LLQDLFMDSFVTQWRSLLKWSTLTGQSSQIDTGYVAQHVASIILGEPGQGFRGKGVDLMDRTEVKSAAIISGVDRPRWNHNLGTPTQDEERRAKGLQPVWQDYLDAPNAFYLLFDRVFEGVGENELVLRVRAWCVDCQNDAAWRSLIETFLAQRSERQYNLQLHPPVGYDDSIVVDTLGNLDMAEIKMLEARIFGIGRGSGEFRVEWLQEPPDPARPVEGRCRALPYGGRSDRPSRLNTAADVLPDTETLRELLPDVDVDAVIAALREEMQAPADPDIK
jgi:hypothetical protein